MMKRNLYGILGISQEADLAEIKKAYWRAAKRFHPDISPGTAKKFREVQEAYDILSDPQRRPHYDKEFSKRPAVRITFVETIFSPPKRLDFLDRFFSDFKDRWFGPFTEILGRPPKGPASLAAEIILTPEEAEQGGEMLFPVPCEFLWEACRGSGRFAGFLCDHCSGSGKIGRKAEFRLQIPPGVRNGLVRTFPLREFGYQKPHLTITFLINRH